MKVFPRSLARYLVVLALAAAALAVYWPTSAHPFIEVYDDAPYIVDNPAVRGGLTWEGVRWAFTTTQSANWHPLTWLSHMADVELFGLDPGRHHLAGVVFHAANAALLFWVLQGMTGAIWRSAFVAALFAVHPLHVESVAWAAERKDLLSTLFFFLSLWAYGGYARTGSRARYAAVVVFFVLGLMSKPMVVTLPFVLLLLDVWPLGRYPAEGARGEGAWPLVREKLPLFALSAASCVVTFLAQASGGAVGTMEVIPFGARLANAAVSYGAYLWKTVWPSRLAVLYPHPWVSPGGIPAWETAVSWLGLAGLTALCVWQRRRRPYLAAGWFWYLGTLVPVIGLVQVGSQGMADRYTYIPLVGVFVMAAWGVTEALGGRRHGRWALAAGGIAAVVALSAAARVQAEYWRGSEPLFRHALEVTSRNWLAHNNLGSALAREGKIAEAAGQYRQAVGIHPDEVVVRYNLGSALLAMGRYAEAAEHLEAAVALRPDYFYARANLGYALLRLGRTQEAAFQFREVLRVNPGDEVAKRSLEEALRAGTSR